MLTDLLIGIFIVFYFALVIGSMGALCYAWWRDRVRKRKPKLRLVKGDKDA